MPLRKIIVLCYLLLVTCSLAIAQTLSLDEAIRALGGPDRVEFRWDPFFASGVFSSGGYEAAFASGQRGEAGAVLLDHREVLTLPLPYLERGEIVFPEFFISQVRHTFDRYVDENLNSFRIAAIIIDPGHGGRDSGAAWDYRIGGRTVKIMEKDIVLDVSMRLHALLAASFPDKRLYLTRSADINKTLEERTEMANSVNLAENEAAIFISVHANSSFNRQARGFEVWYLTPSYRRDLIDHSRFTESQEIIPILNSMLEEGLTTDSILLANSILARIDESVGAQSPNRGLKAYDWFVVRNARMASVLVELGFVSNESEAILMSSEAYLKKLSEALYKGIADFISFFERTGGLAVLQ